MKLTKKQFYVLWISITFLIPLSYTLYIRVSNYKAISRELTNEKKIYYMIADKKHITDEEASKGYEAIDALKTLPLKNEIAEQKAMQALWNVFYLVSFTALFLVFFNDRERKKL